MDNRGKTVRHSIDMRRVFVALGLALILAAGTAQAAEDRVRMAMQAVDRNDCPVALNLLRQAAADEETAAVRALAFLSNSKLCPLKTVDKGHGLDGDAPEGAEGKIAAGRLGCMYQDGVGRPKDATQARYWFKRAALAANPLLMPALTRFVMMTKLGPCGLSKMLAEEFDWVLEIDVSDAHRKFRVAMDLREGRRLPREDTVAMRWLSDASDSIPAAEYEIGRWHLEGVSGVRNVEEGLWLLESAGKNGFAPALKELGMRYATGRGTEKNAKTAIYWLRCAQFAGADVKDLLAELGGTPSELGREYDRDLCFFR
jgi:TPR repeat protein